MSFSGFTDNAVATTVINEDWWPGLRIDEFQKLYRIPAEYETDMVADALLQAMIWANRQFAEWQAAQVVLGYASLEDVPGEEIGSQLKRMALYARAVFCHAKALLMPQFKTMMRRADAKNEALEAEDTENKWFQYAEQAVADFLGRSRINVELL